MVVDSVIPRSRNNANSIRVIATAAQSSNDVRRLL